MINWPTSPTVEPQAFVDYLKGEHIDCQIEPLEQGVAILVIHDKDLEQARTEFAHFMAHPYDSKYLQASWEHGDTQTKIDYGALRYSYLPNSLPAQAQSR